MTNDWSQHMPAMMLGKIEEMLNEIVQHTQSNFSARHSGLFEGCNSKHTIDPFITAFSNPNELEDLHNEIRFIGSKIFEIQGMIHSLKYKPE